MSSDQHAKKIIGTWHLKDWHSLKNGEFYAYPMGEDGKGQLTYSATGRMAGFLMRADFGSEPARSNTDAKKSLAYSGNWRIEGEDVCHDVDIATIPEWIGTTLVRTMVWQGDNLLLKTDPQKGPDGNSYQNLLLWEKLEEGKIHD